MTAPKIYNYHPATGEFLGAGQADPDPLNDGEWLYPAHSTSEAPPAPDAGYVAAFVPGSGWTTLPDHRGETWWKEGQAYTIDGLGDPADEGFSPDGPPETGEDETAVWENGEWVIKIDHRGETWWADHETPITIDFFGDPADQGLSPERPEPEPELEPEPEPEPEPVDPLTVELPRREFRRALLHNGMDTAAILAVIDAIGDANEREEMVIWWEDTIMFQRQHPILVQMVSSAGLTPAQGDAIWVYGVGLLNDPQ